MLIFIGLVIIYLSFCGAVCFGIGVLIAEVVRTGNYVGLIFALPLLGVLFILLGVILS